jgi:hypothetical protein
LGFFITQKIIHSGQISALPSALLQKLSTDHLEVRIMIKTLLFGIALTFTALAGCASTGNDGSAQTASKRECISARSLTNWNEIGDDFIHLEAVGNNHFVAELLGACPNLKNARTVALKGSGWICGNDIGTLVYRDITGPRQCRFTHIASVSGLEEARVKATAKRAADASEDDQR